jgi:hypothetical protein
MTLQTRATRLKRLALGLGARDAGCCSIAPLNRAHCRPATAAPAHHHPGRRRLQAEVRASEGDIYSPLSVFFAATFGGRRGSGMNLSRS